MHLHLAKTCLLISLSQVLSDRVGKAAVLRIIDVVLSSVNPQPAAMQHVLAPTCCGLFRIDQLLE